MKNKVLMTILFIGFIVLMSTVSIFYIIDLNENQDNYYPFLFILLSEVILFCGLAFINNFSKNKIILYSIFSTIALSYFLLNISIAFFVNELGMTNYSIVQIILLSILIILTSISVIFSYYTNISNETNLSMIKITDSYIKRISNLVVNSKYLSYSKQLRIILDKLIFCDKIGICLIDKDIERIINELENNELNNDNLKIQLNDTISNLLLLLEIKNNDTLQYKRGGF